MSDGAKVLGTILYPGFELLDVFGPLEMFGALVGALDIKMIAQQSGSVKSAQGPASVIDHDFASCPKLDLMLIPGGIGTRTEIDNPAMIDFLRRQVPETETVMTVCTGTALLAFAGLLDGYRATTNKMFFQWVTEQGPKVQWVKEARWVEDGKFVTSSGVSAGMDMALAVIARMFGPEMSKNISIGTEYEWHQDSNWDPFAKVHGLV